MKRLIAVLSVAAWSLVASAQSTDPNSTDLAPQDRVRGGRIQSNAPGVHVREAIARHTQNQTDRVTRARFGLDPNTSTNESTSGSGTSGSSGGLGSLLNLVNQFGGSGSLGVGSLSDITSLLGGLTNLGGGGMTTTSGSGTTGTDTSGSNGVDPRLQQLLDLRDAAIGSGGSTNGSNLKAVQRSSTTSGSLESSGAIAKLWKPSDRSQTTTDGTTDRSFKDRLLESWATAGFTALSVGFQTPQFISFLESGLRTIFRPKANAELVALVQALDEFVKSIIDLAGTTGDTTGNDTTNGDTTGNDTTNGDTTDTGTSVL